MTKLSLAEIQKAELDIMVVFDQVARENNLKYSLCAGTLLGAVRHKGFIPWDDDIDVTMPRPDYEKLLQLNREKTLWP
ncbi:MAG: LicD family protein, partial [Lachnospiraceae bacterium]|nr:LicD family protein [Lachnospiraceae bacterium]